MEVVSLSVFCDSERLELHSSNSVVVARDP